MNRYGSKIIKHFSWLIIYLILLSFLCACFYSPSKEKSVYFNDRVDLLVLYQYSVPFVGESLEPVGDIEIYPVEVDNYGRTLGIMKGNSLRRSPLFGENAVYCVVQCGSKEESCFYEDSCCIIVENGSDDQEAIEQLKLDNDWNLPLNVERSRRIPIKDYSAAEDYNTDYGYNYNYYTKKALSAAGWSSDSAWLDVIGKDGNGLWLFSLMRNADKDDSPICLVMMKEDYSQGQELSVVGIQLLENRASPWKEIRAFKVEIGWKFVDEGNTVCK